MLTTILVVVCALLVISKRADQVHSARVGAVREAGVGESRADMSPRNTAAGRSTLAARSLRVPVSLTAPLPRTYRGHTAAHWAALYRHRTRQYQNARRVLMARASVTEAINLACIVYGNCATLWSLARCESGLNPGARNASGSSGLMQFMPGTFSGTPFGRLSIWSPYANALAAGWMLQQGRRYEWVC